MTTINSIEAFHERLNDLIRKYEVYIDIGGQVQADPEETENWEYARGNQTAYADAADDLRSLLRDVVNSEGYLEDA